VVLGGAPVNFDHVEVLGRRPALIAHITKCVDKLFHKRLKEVGLHHLVDLVQIGVGDLLEALRADNLAVLHVEVLVELVLEDVGVVAADHRALLDLLHRALLHLGVEEQLDISVVLLVLPGGVVSV